MYEELNKYIKANDNTNANHVVMVELGKSLISNRDNFLDIFDNAGIRIDPNSSDVDLINKFIDNAPKNKKLLLGASYLINHKYRTISFDGQEEVNNSGVKATYKVMDEYFNASGLLSAVGGLFGSKNSGGGGAAATANNGGGAPVAVPTGLISAAATAVGKGADLANTLAKNHANKKNAVTNSLDKANAASQSVLQGAMAQNQALLNRKTVEKKSQDQLLTTLLLVGGGIATVSIGLILYFRLKN